MYAYFIGKIVSVQPESVVMEVNHIGYNIKVSAGTIQNLGHMSGEIKLAAGDGGIFAKEQVSVVPKAPIAFSGTVSVCTPAGKTVFIPITGVPFPIGPSVVAPAMDESFLPLAIIGGIIMPLLAPRAPFHVLLPLAFITLSSRLRINAVT